MAILLNCVVALAITCVAVNAKVHNPYDDEYYAYDASSTNPWYQTPCKFNYPYDPAELASLEKKLQTCMSHLPSVNFPTNTPSLDCAIAGVNTLRNTQSRSVAGVPAAVVTCLRLPRYASILNERLITKAETCIKGAVARGL